MINYDFINGKQRIGEFIRIKRNWKRKLLEVFMFLLFSFAYSGMLLLLILNLTGFYNN